MSLQIDASQITQFSAVMARAPQKLGQEVAKEINTGAKLGETAAKGNINSRSGRLAGSIKTRQLASAGSLSASYGTSKGEVIYAMQREYGGIIRAKNAKFLVFRGSNGGMVAVKQVSQKGSHYMARSLDQIRGRVMHGIAGAVQRVIASLG